MKLPFKAKLRNAIGGKYPNYVVTVPAAYGAFLRVLVDKSVLFIKVRW
jgi:hypothetical protein